MLTANAWSIQLWKVCPKTIYNKPRENARRMCKKGRGLVLPSRGAGEATCASKPLHTFKHGNEHNLHSLSLSPDGENFLAADETRISLWNLDYNKRTTVFDLLHFDKAKTQGLVSSASFNQQGQDCMFLYTTSRGTINVCDFRERSDFSARPSLQLSTSLANNYKQDAYSKWLDYVSSATLLGDTKQIVSRDYLSVKLWDLRGTGDLPLYSAQVTDYMERNLQNLHEQDSLDDEFFMNVSPDGRHLVTGGYNKSAHVIDIAATTNTVVQCNYNPTKNSQAGKLKTYNKQKRVVGFEGETLKMDSSKQVTLGAWAPIQTPSKNSPFSHTMAVSYRNCIYMYNGCTAEPKL